MRAYINVVWDILNMLPEYTLSVVPRSQNLMADSLAKTTSNFKIPIFSNIKFEIHVKHRLQFLINCNIGKYFGMINKLIIFYKVKVSSRIV